MTAAARLHRLLLLVAAASLLVPVAAAEDGQLTASSASYRGGADLAGDAVAFFLSEASSADGPAARPTANLDIRAQRLEALQIESRYIVPSAGDVSNPVTDPRFDPTTPPSRTVLEDAHARLDGQVDFQMHLIPAAGLCAFTAHGDAGDMVSLASLMVDTGRFDEATPLDAEDRGDDNPEFWAVRHDDAVVRHQDLGSASFTFTGDMVLEFLGGTLDARDRDERVTLESGTWREAVAPSGLPAGGLDAERTVLLRMFLTGATVRINVLGEGADVLLATPDLSATPASGAQLTGASGRVVSDGDMLTLDNEPFTVPAGNVLGVRPGDGALALEVHPAPASTGVDPAGLSAAGWPGQLAMVLAILAVGAGVALALLRRRASHTDLRAVEAAIEGGRYGRAARLAKRVLRVQPGLEDAVLGRAIALSKSGRAGTAIAELHEHLARHGASDGSLHYVLGLSFLDVGRMADARAALLEAVRLTPALAEEVQSRLATQASSGAPPTAMREVNGYA